MLEMASLGSKVLQIRSVEFAGKYRVRLRVLSSFEDEGEGTLITFEEDQKMEQAIISGIAFNRDEAKITILGVPDRPGIAYQILGPMGDANIDVDMIVQNVSHDGMTDFSFTVHRNDYQKTLKILEPVLKHIKARDVDGDDKIVKVSVVGVGMRSHAGIASTDVPHPGRGRHQHPDDLHLGDQDLGRGRREIPGAWRCGRCTRPSGLRQSKTRRAWQLDR